MATSEHFDDVFDEDGDELLAEKDWKKMKEAIFKDGFRDGVATGQDTELQRGFNRGYRRAVTVAHGIAKLRGVLSAMIGHHLSAGSGVVSRGGHDELKALLSRVDELEHAWLQHVKDNKNRESSAENVQNQDKDNENRETGSQNVQEPQGFDCMSGCQNKCGDTEHNNERDKTDEKQEKEAESYGKQCRTKSKDTTSTVVDDVNHFQQQLDLLWTQYREISDKHELTL